MVVKVTENIKLICKHGTHIHKYRHILCISLIHVPFLGYINQIFVIFHEIYVSGNKCVECVLADHYNNLRYNKT